MSAETEGQVVSARQERVVEWNGMVFREITYVYEYPKHSGSRYKEQQLCDPMGGNPSPKQQVP